MELLRNKNDVARDIVKRSADPSAVPPRVDDILLGDMQLGIPDRTPTVNEPWKRS